MAHCQPGADVSRIQATDRFEVPPSPLDVSCCESAGSVQLFRIDGVGTSPLEERGSAESEAGVLQGSLANFAAGVMVYISLDEILPLAFRYGKEHHVIIGIVTGMLVMAISLFMFS